MAGAILIAYDGSPPARVAVREAAELFLAEATRLAESAPGRCCILAAGETTVKVKGRGRGGRNQEFALALTPHLARSARAITASTGRPTLPAPSSTTSR